MPPAKTREAFEYLKKCARQMRTVSHDELASATGLAPIGIGHQLGYIRDDICRKRQLPWLSAIAVNVDTWQPGHSFLPDDVDFGDEGARLWRGMVLHVFAFDWDAVPFEEV